MAPIKTLLIANRGEIASRIIRTARRMGISTVAIYSVADRNSLHVQLADHAFCVGEAPATASYLHIDKLLEVARQSKAQAIHPGYGFLSENPAFARACADNNILFVGPPVAAMEAMASKQWAKQLLENKGVPLTPGYHGHDQSDERLLQEARLLGFPVLLKAASGGGGKGMREVNQEEDFAQALAGARREATAYFADDTFILEKLILSPRHIEMQIMADNQGNAVHLFERDCSIQRRHQKIIEEAPAPNLCASLREKIAQAAITVAKTIDYRGAGTVEFLLDPQGNFYFMEMNTRLQVEHPVTEMITGLDLVEWQLRIAAGESLPLTQAQIMQHGHAIECRIYAEDPAQGFMPSIGKIHFLQEPQGMGIRIDSGIAVGSDVSQYYDPMIAKLIAWGDDREHALRRLDGALKQYAVGGVKTNIGFLQAVLTTPDFIQATLSTAFLTQVPVQLPQADKSQAIVLATTLEYLQTIASLSDDLQRDTFAWQMHVTGHWTKRYRIDQDTFEARVTPGGADRLRIQLDEHTVSIQAKLTSANRLRLDDGTHQTEYLWEAYQDSLIFYMEGGPIQVGPFAWQNVSENTRKQGQLTAPMPATIVAILKNTGDRVKTGERLMILEAMKMEHTVLAPHDGLLSAIFYTVGSQVKEGAELIALEEE